ncbi:response regulator [Candidatus Saccharibacteria bacterium]|nr:response regulator [Candidatus Saccharibacteria bacterium]
MPEDPTTQPIKVLCIEDERFIGELYKRSLVNAGYDVTLARNGNDGLEQAKTNTYDIILLDIMIPEILGVDVLKKLRINRWHTTVPANLI